MLESSLVYSSETNIYVEQASQYGSSYIRKTIDGRQVGCSKCVGFCQYDGHPGFLTAEQRDQHNCLQKNCYYYVSKPAKEKKRSISKNITCNILSVANENIVQQEGIRFLNAVEYEYGKWHLEYVTITNEYSLTSVQKLLEDTFNCEIVFSRKKYSYERCIQILFGI